MALFSDVDILNAMAWGKIEISPFDDGQLEACSYDVRLSNEFKVFDPALTEIDPRRETVMQDIVVDPDKAFVLQPGSFALGSTLEVVALADSVASRFEGKSSIGRLGLLTHVTAAFVDAGYRGRITLELANVSSLPLQVWPGMRIGQLCFFDLLSPSRRPYSSGRNHYQGQEGPVASRAHLQFQEDVA